MLFKLFLMFFLVPLIELYLLIKLGQLIGAVNTVLLVVITAGLGAFFAKTQGLAIVLEIKFQLSQGRLPGNSLIEGALILIAGFVLLTPGLLTDIFGFLLLIPVSRRQIREWVKDWFRGKIKGSRSGQSGYLEDF